MIFYINVIQLLLFKYSSVSAVSREQSHHCFNNDRHTCYVIHIYILYAHFKRFFSRVVASQVLILHIKHNITVARQQVYLPTRTCPLLFLQQLLDLHKTTVKGNASAMWHFGFVIMYWSLRLKEKKIPNIVIAKLKCSTQNPTTFPSSSSSFIYHKHITL